MIAFPVLVAIGVALLNPAPVIAASSGSFEVEDIPASSGSFDDVTPNQAPINSGETQGKNESTPKLSPGAPRTSGGQGGSGGAASIRIDGNNYGTVIVIGGDGGSGGKATVNEQRSSANETAELAPEKRGRAIKFVISSRASYIQYLKFFSETHVWPGRTRAYILDSRKPISFRLNCELGEKICFGAYDSSTKSGWGVGRYGDKGCENCCAVCKADRIIVRYINLADQN